MLRENPGSLLCSMDAGWYQGSVKVVACDSHRSADLYKHATSKLVEVYEGANIIALDWCDDPPGGHNTYQPSEPTADACLTEQKWETSTLTCRTTSMNLPLKKRPLEEPNELHGRPSALIRQPRLRAMFRRQMDHGQTPVESS